MLRDGTIAQYATPQDLYARPVDDELARFVGEANLLEGVMEDGYVQTQFGKLPATRREDGSTPMPYPVNVLIRPEQINLSPANDDDERATTASIVKADYHGHDSLIHVQLSPEHGGRLLVVRALGSTRLAPGTQVTLTIRDAVLAWPR